MNYIVPDHIIQQADSAFQNPKTYPERCPKCAVETSRGSFIPERLRNMSKRAVTLPNIRPQSPVGGKTAEGSVIRAYYSRVVTYCVPCKKLLWLVLAKAER